MRQSTLDRVGVPQAGFIEQHAGDGPEAVIGHFIGAIARAAKRRVERVLAYRPQRRDSYNLPVAMGFRSRSDRPRQAKMTRLVYRPRCEAAATSDYGRGGAFRRERAPSPEANRHVPRATRSRSRHGAQLRERSGARDEKPVCAGAWPTCRCPWRGAEGSA